VISDVDARTKLGITGTRSSHARTARTHHSSFITHHSSFITHHSSLIIHHSSLITHHSSFLRCPKHGERSEQRQPRGECLRQFTGSLGRLTSWPRQLAPSFRLFPMRLRPLTLWPRQLTSWLRQLTLPFRLLTPWPRQLTLPFRLLTPWPRQLTLPFRLLTPWPRQLTFSLRQLTLSFRPRRLLSAKCCNQKGLGCRVGKANAEPTIMATHSLERAVDISTARMWQGKRG